MTMGGSYLSELKSLVTPWNVSGETLRGVLTSEQCQAAYATGGATSWLTLY